MTNNKYNIIKLKINDSLFGTWCPTDIHSDVKIIISKDKNKYMVEVIDDYDDEHAEIYDINYDEDKSRLHFSSHWSSGRFVKYSLMLQTKDTVSVTYTYTTKEIFNRKS